MPWPRVVSAVRKRTVVPLLPTNRSAVLEAGRPAHPVMSTIMRLAVS